MQLYKEDKITVRPDLIGKEAEENAKKILKVSPTQMRRIFNQFKALNNRIEKEGWGRIEPLVKLQKAQLEYTIRRGQKSAQKDEKIELDILKNILKEALDSVQNDKDYRVITLYIEALYAYYYANTTKRV
ncbi:MAG TPA: type III-A CRISPR-associated protein Csm2 [Treponema sp.]|nr:type III-A CRISPR-associated protein Csm2 [Treponema sp.]